MTVSKFLDLWLLGVVVGLLMTGQAHAANVLAGLKKVGDIWHDTVMYVGGIMIVGGLIFTGVQMMMHHQASALMGLIFVLFGGGVALFADDIVNMIRPANAMGAQLGLLLPTYVVDNLAEMARQLGATLLLTEGIRRGRHWTHPLDVPGRDRTGV